MSMKSLLQVRKFMANKSFVVITGLLGLSIISNAYSLNTAIFIKNLISPNHPYYSKNGYKVEPDGQSDCMHGVYHPRSHTAIYGKHRGKIGLHYSAMGRCILDDSYQDFKVTNEDTGKVMGRFEWYKQAGLSPYIHMIDNPGHFIEHIRPNDNKLNILCDF
ncbi:hypothetical protein [Candidatus Sororendozoicomonas aggregata]|uniref:hypothetical protein n=1 Tax=Candidatus Sororendozoicomonas aggregata TaxID=3073239 RepID=UPI002ED3D488